MKISKLVLIEKLKSVFLYIFKDVVCYQILTNYLIAFKDWWKHLKTGAYVVKSLKAQSKIKQFFCYGTKTNNRLFLRINRLFWFSRFKYVKNSFQSFLNTSKYKQSVVSTKQQVVFHLGWKTFFFQKYWECLCFGFNQEWITTLKLPQILTTTAQQQQAQQSLQHPSRGLDSSKLEQHMVQHKYQSICMTRRRVRNNKSIGG